MREREIKSEKDLKGRKGNAWSFVCMCQDDCFAIHSDFVHDIAKKEVEMIQMLRNEDTIEDFNALSMQLHDLWMEITTKSMKSSKTAQWLISAFNDKVLQQIGLSAFDLYLLGQLMQATLPILDQELLRMFLTTYLWQKSDSLTHMAKTEEGTNVLLVALALRQQWTESGQSVEPLLKQLLTFFAQTEKLQETAWLNIPCWRMIVSHILAWKNEQDEGSVVTDLPMLFSWYPENLMERLQVCRNIFQSFKRQEKSIKSLQEYQGISKSLQDYDNIEDTNMFWFAKEIQAAAKAFKDLWWHEDEAKDEWAILILDVTLYYCEDLENSAKVAKNVPLFRSLLMMPHIFRKSTPAMEIKEKLVALGKDILHQMATSDAARIVILNVIRNKHVDSAVLEDFFTISPMSKDLFLRGACFIVCTVLERSKDHHDTWARWLCEEAGLCLHVLAVPLMEILFEQSPSLASVKYLAESFTFISKGVYMIGPDGSLTHCRWEKDFVKSRILLDKSWQKIACLLYHISGPVADHMETLAWRTRNITIQEAVKAAKDYAMAQEQLHIYE